MRWRQVRERKPDTLQSSLPGEKYMKHARAMTVAILLGVLGLPLAMAQKDEIRDAPPDLHQYNREALPEDTTPGGELALPMEILGMGGVANGILIKDVVISNTDKNLKNTNRSPNGEPSIAVNPSNPSEIDILAFTAGWGTDAPVWHSSNGGNIWSLESTIPSPPGLSQTGCPCDQTPDYGRNNQLSALASMPTAEPPPIRRRPQLGSGLSRMAWRNPRIRLAEEIAISLGCW